MTDKQTFNIDNLIIYNCDKSEKDSPDRMASLDENREKAIKEKWDINKKETKLAREILKKADILGSDDPDDQTDNITSAMFIAGPNDSLNTLISFVNGSIKKTFFIGECDHKTCNHKIPQQWRIAEALWDEILKKITCEQLINGKFQLALNGAKLMASINIRTTEKIEQFQKENFPEEIDINHNDLPPMDDLGAQA